MRKRFLCSGYSLAGLTFLCGFTACSNNENHKGGPGTAGATNTAGATSTAGASTAGASGGLMDASTPMPDAGCMPSGSKDSSVLIDDMETTTHGPILLSAGIAPPLSPGYWYNSGANYVPDDAGAGSADSSNPPQGSFVFSALSKPATTLNCKTSAHAARQSCVLNGLYDTCALGFEFAQQPDGDAGAGDPRDAGTGGGPSDAGDAGPPIPMVSVPFDISRYKAITFWGMTTTPDSTGSLQVKVQFPDTDTDPRGQICNGGGLNTSKCYNSYAALLSFTPTWQQFTVVLDAGGEAGAAPTNGIAIDPSWGYQQAQWIPTQVYGINWQAQRDVAPDAGAPLMTEIWVDDVYFQQ